MSSKRFLILTLLILSTIGCGEERQPIVQEVEAIPYLKQFETDAARYGITLTTADVSVVFVGESEMWNPATLAYSQGICTVSSSGLTIRLLKPYWNKAGIWTKRALMYHELGHCILGRRHSSSMQSLMYTSSTAVEDFFRSNESQTLDELFNNGGN